MKYVDPKFSSRPATAEYRERWERTFGGPPGDSIREAVEKTLANLQEYGRQGLPAPPPQRLFYGPAKPRRAKKR